MQRTNEADQKAQAEKRPYAKPELVKHGNVESTTQGLTGPSSPWYAN
jgi:hypothetical protein